MGSCRQGIRWWEIDITYGVLKLLAILGIARDLRPFRISPPRARGGMMRIAVIGSGISGMAAAYYLSRKHEVFLFEKEPRLGGHTHTVTVESSQRPAGGGHGVHRPQRPHISEPGKAVCRTGRRDSAERHVVRRGLPKNADSSTPAGA